MSGELNTDNTDATGFSQMAVVTTPPIEGRLGRGLFFLILQRYDIPLAECEL